MPPQRTTTRRLKQNRQLGQILVDDLRRAIHEAVGIRRDEEAMAALTMASDRSGFRRCASPEADPDANCYAGLGVPAPAIAAI